MTKEQLAEFKVGDRVEIVGPCNVGCVGNLDDGLGDVKHLSADVHVSLKHDTGQTLTWCFDDRSSLRILPSETPRAFKVGDRVKYTDPGGHTENDDRGVLTRIDKSDGWWANWERTGMEQRADTKNLTHLTETETTETTETTELQTKGTEPMKLTQVQKQYPTKTDILEAFFSDNGTLNTNSEEFGLWFMSEYHNNESLNAIAKDKLEREAKELE